MLYHVMSPLVQLFMWFLRENIADMRDVELGLLQCGGGVWGPGPSVVGVGRFEGWLVLERTSKIAVLAHLVIKPTHKVAVYCLCSVNL